MIPVLVFTHGEYAEALLGAARMICPGLETATAALGLPWEADADFGGELLRQQIKTLDEGNGVLILTDMFGGTATNIALSLLEPSRIEVVTGVNLPILVKLVSVRGQNMSLPELAACLTAAGRKSICVASDYLSHD